MGDGFQPIGLDSSLLVDRLETVRRAAEAAGRDPDAIELTLGGSLATFDEEQLERLSMQGADRILLSATTADLAELGDQMSNVGRWI